MNKRTSFFVLLICTYVVFAQQPAARTGVARGDVQRGRYIANDLAMCVQCHTPRGTDGQLLLDRAFGGAPIPATKPAPWGTWAEFAPRIAGLPQYSTEQMITLLTTGIGREGKPLRAPMPPFKMNRQDAEDVTAYLKSLR